MDSCGFSQERSPRRVLEFSPATIKLIFQGMNLQQQKIDKCFRQNCVLYNKKAEGIMAQLLAG